MRIQVIRSETVRLNYDQTLRPTLLLHMGAGFIRYNNPDTVPPGQRGFRFHDRSAFRTRLVPAFRGSRPVALGGNVYGGLAIAVGPGSRGLLITNKPTGTAQLTWIRGNHSYKAGGEYKHDSFTNISYVGLEPGIQLQHR